MRWAERRLHAIDGLHTGIITNKKENIGLSNPQLLM